MPKIFVLDTSAILAVGSRVFEQFGDNEVVIPLAVVRELESKRSDFDLGFNARSALKYLEDLRDKGNNLSTPTVINDEGGTIRIELNHVSQAHLPDSLKNERTTDVRILAVATALQSETGNEVVLISKDLPMRLIANTSLGLTAQDLQLSYTPMEELGVIHTYYISDAEMEELQEEGSLSKEQYKNLSVNTKVILKSHSDPSSSALAVVAPDGYLELAYDGDAGVVEAKSAEQQFAISDLYDEQVRIVSIGGKAGSGKTMLSLVSAVDQVMDTSTPYRKVVIYRPVTAIPGQDMGYLPGEVEDKMAPYAEAAYSALEAAYPKEKIAWLKTKGIIEVKPLTYIRGQTFNKQFVILDEAQNLELTTIVTVLSRLGKDSKLAITWDLSQRDNLYLGRYDGIWEVVQKLSGSSMFSHTTLKKSERSKIAELVGNLFDEYI